MEHSKRRTFVVPGAIILAILVATTFAMEKTSTSKDSLITHSEEVRIAKATANKEEALTRTSDYLNRAKVVSASPDLQVLPTTWCGAQTNTDLTVNTVTNSAPKFKFFYVRAADQPDNSAGINDLIQYSVSNVHSFVANQSGFTKTFRFDLGTGCGKEYVDIQNIVLPKSLAYYRNGSTDSSTDQNRVIADLAAYSMNASKEPYRHPIYFLDGFGNPTVLSGYAETPVSEAVSNNAANAGGYSAFIVLPYGVSSSEYQSITPELVTHEMTHTIGAVQLGAPHSSGAYHCVDLIDVMCYNDGGPKTGTMLNVCPSIASNTVITASFDCGQDDYFNPAPANGSYLATHWNLFNSSFLTACLDQTETCADNLRSQGGKGSTRITHFPYKKQGKKWRAKKSKRLKATVVTTTTPDYEAQKFRFSITSGKVRVPKGYWKIETCVAVIKPDMKTIDKNYGVTCHKSKRRIRKKSVLVKPASVVGSVLTSKEYLFGFVKISPVSSKKQGKTYFSSEQPGKKKSAVAAY